MIQDKLICTYTNGTKSKSTYIEYLNIAVQCSCGGSRPYVYHFLTIIANINGCRKLEIWSPVFVVRKISYS